MKSVMKGALALLALSMLTVGASAQAKKPSAKAATCPACHMTLSKKKTKATPIAVKTKNGTLYCCAGCAMNKKKK